MNLQKNLLRKRAHAFGLEPVAESSSSEPEKVKSSVNADIPVEELCDPAIKACFPIQDVYSLLGDLILHTYYRPPSLTTAPIYICHHGAGSSGMTFWAIANQCMKQQEEAGFFAFDMRGHGKSPSPVPADYSLETLTQDFSLLVAEFHVRHASKNPICLIGHSLGGAVATNYVSQNPPNVRALVMVDIVEETAVRSLLSVPQFLNSRPKSFSSLSEAVNWHLLTHLLRNEASARISVGDLLHVEDGKLLWTADFAAMQPFWDTWFVGLSSRFVSCNSSVAKMLVLSSNDTLDKDLMIGQMQGRYQLVVFNNTTNAAHFLHEDIPKQFLMSVQDFMRRNDTSKFMLNKSKIETLWGGAIN